MDPQSPDTPKSRRVYFLANPDKPDTESVLSELERFAASRCHVVGAQLGLDGRVAIEAGAEYLVIIGGDGTLIGVARSLGADQVPLIGINMGKLGFLAQFSVDEFKGCLDRILSDPTLVRRRMLLEATVQGQGGVQPGNIAVNDCVIQAGPPFRSIRLGISIDGIPLTEVTGDGLIVCTPIGSTAHNLSAGGPILQPGIDAMVLTPLCPHSLTHKPLVIERDSVIEVRATRVNEGTTATIDGQVSCPLQPGDCVVVRRFSADLLRVHHPDRAGWHNLVTKFHWGKSPDYY